MNHRRISTMTQEIKKPSPHFNKWALYKLAIKIDYDLFCWMMLASHKEGESCMLGMVALVHSPLVRTTRLYTLGNFNVEFRYCILLLLHISTPTSTHQYFMAMVNGPYLIVMIFCIYRNFDSRDGTYTTRCLPKFFPQM